MNAALDHPLLTRDEAGTLFSRTMNLVAATIVLFAGGAYAARDVSPGWIWVFFLAAFGMLFGLSAAAKRSAGLAVGLLVAFGFLMGAAVAPTLGYYARSDPRALWEAGLATALFVGGFGATGYATRRDLSKLARTFFWALIALIVFGVVVVLVDLPHGSVIYAVIGLVIFAGLVSYDFQRLRRARDLRSAPLLAASIFLDVVNVFLLFLNLGTSDNG